MTSYDEKYTDRRTGNMQKLCKEMIDGKPWNIEALHQDLSYATDPMLRFIEACLTDSTLNPTYLPTSLSPKFLLESIRDEMDKRLLKENMSSEEYNSFEKKRQKIIHMEHIFDGLVKGHPWDLDEIIKFYTYGSDLSIIFMMAHLKDKDIEPIFLPGDVTPHELLGKLEEEAIRRTIIRFKKEERPLSDNMTLNEKRQVAGLPPLKEYLSKKPVTTVTVQIGNTDNKLTQHDWSNFIKSVDLIMNQWSDIQVHFHGCSNPDSIFQNACWVAEMGHHKTPVKRDLQTIAQNFGQDGIAWTEGETIFLEPKKAGAI